MSKSLKGVLVVVTIIAISGSYLFPRVQQVAQQAFSGISNPDSYLPFFGINDVRHFYTRQALVLATTTPCAIKSPAATSTLVSAAAQVTVSSTTATTWVFAKSATAFATTTRLDQFSLSSGVQGTMVASTTSVFGAAPTVDDSIVFAPNTYLVISKSGDTPAGTKLAGVCQAEFLRI